MKIVVDGMGGDNAPQAIVAGAVAAAEELPAEYRICLVGDETALRRELEQHQYDAAQISVRHCSEAITMEDAPVRAIRTKKDSSIVVGINMVKKGEGDLFISAGNSGALMAGGLLLLGRIRGVDRPAIASIYPVLGGRPSLLVDAGANSECRPANLLEFATMGSIYMEKVIGRANPTVGLVNIGAESTKGSPLTKSAYQLLEESDLHFIGNVEARDVPQQACDIIVCDGFVGNVILKLTEGLAWNILGLLRRKFTDGPRAKLGALMLRDKLGELKREFDYSEYGGAPILGVRGGIIKTHGSAGTNAVRSTILKAIPFAEENVVEVIQDSMRKGRR